MFAEVKVVSPAEYQQWYKDKQAAIQQARDEQAKERPKYDSGSK